MTGRRTEGLGYSAEVEGPGPHWASLACWVLFAVNATGNNTHIRQ